MVNSNGDLLVSSPRARQATACRPSKYHHIITAMRCFHHLRWVAADDGHTITRTATITHGHALLPTACGGVAAVGRC